MLMILLAVFWGISKELHNFCANLDKLQVDLVVCNVVFMFYGEDNLSVKS